ncbi:hypothetical protein G3M48_005236 [Beauveria asiatica]|uniref:Myb/SANT-like domain-containing protein n=1 Tax=Beauveria asiatica TaxID=1069075 RepID=A0AAW0RSB3_9HYPO
MTPPTSTPATARPRRTVLRWKSVEVLFLLSLLLEAKRDNLLNTTKVNLLDPVFQSIVDKMTTNFPRRPFTMENIRSKFRDFRRLWLIFLEAESTPGTTINHEQGTLNMSDVNIQKVVDVHGDIGSRVLQYGMPCGLDVNLDSWREIFDKDIARGRFIRTANQKRRQAADGDTNVDEAARTPTPAPRSRGSSSVSRGRRGGRGSSQGSSLSAARQRLAAGQAASQTTAVAHKEHIHHHEIPGAIDIEQAVEDLQRLDGEMEPEQLVRSAYILGKEPHTAVVWNKLNSKKAKFKFIAMILVTPIIYY